MSILQEEIMKISKNAMLVLEKRYIAKDKKGNPAETVEGLFRRVAKAIAQADANYGGDTKQTEEVFYKLMTNLEFLPNSPTLMNAGRPLGQLSACFVLPVEDSIEGIFTAIKQAALIHQSGGGTGFSFSRLRSNGSTVNSTGGVASGPVSFIKVFNSATEAIKQGGTRRGANMGILRIDHPDILQFLNCKSNTSEINNFNLSVGITEKFMQAVYEDKDYNLIDPHTKEIKGSLSAKKVFDIIVKNAWQNGEPGIVFLDRLNKDNVVPTLGEIESTNPCGEQPLLPYESCNLGSINLVKMLKHTDKGYVIDYDKLKKTVNLAVHFLDNVIDVNKYPLENIAKMTRSTRKIGLGIMGFADMLLMMNIPYSSEEAVKLGESLMKFINEQGHKASEELAKVRGAFPLFNESIYKDKTPIRNATVTTIAPTGTLSIIAGVSSGIEPVFAYAYIRNIMDKTHMIEINPVLKNKLESLGLLSDELIEKIATSGTLKNIKELPDEIKNVFLSSHDITPKSHVKMQAAFQKHTDNAVSKTVNFQNSATLKDVEEVYNLAFELGCKGTTIYRDGSRESQVLNIGKVKEKEDKTSSAKHVKTNANNTVTTRKRPQVTSGITEQIKIGCGNLYVTVNYDDQGICEVFTSTGKTGGCPSQSEATARLASIALRSGVSVEEIVKQLKGIRCPSTVRQQGLSCTSCPDAIAKVIKKVNDMFNKKGNIAPNPLASDINTNNTLNADDSSKAIKYCPDCGAKLEHEGGCVTCRECGFSKCG